MKEINYKYHFFLIFLSICSCKVNSHIVSVQSVKFKYFTIDVVIDTLTCTVNISMLNTSNDTLYYPDSLIYSLSESQKTSSMFGVFVENFKGGHPPPYEITLKALAPHQSVKYSCVHSDNRKNFHKENETIRFFFITISTIKKLSSKTKRIGKQLVKEDILYFESLRLRSSCRYTMDKTGMSIQKYDEMW